MRFSRVVVGRLIVAPHVGTGSFGAEEIGIGAREDGVSSVHTDTFNVETPTPERLPYKSESVVLPGNAASIFDIHSKLTRPL